MAYDRRCSECSNPVTGKRKTCSDTCRAKRSRRLRAQNGEGESTRRLPEHQAAVAAAVRREAPDIAHKIIEQEMRPVVREAMTEDVLRSIRDMINLTPAAIAALQEDLASPDDTIRQRAYTLILKYTMGHPALVQPKDTDPNQQLVVHFNLPRPDAPVTNRTTYEPVGVVDGELVDELKTCDTCGAEKTADQFVDGSDRCSVCFERLQREITERFGG